MTQTVFPDTEGAARAWLRTVPALGGRRVEFGLPSGAAECITIAEIGGSPELHVPLDHPTLSFTCWASYDSTLRKAGTKAQARAIRDALVGALFDLGTAGHVDITLPGGAVVRLLGAVVTNSLWAPDLTTDPATPRYVVDAEIHAITP